MEKKLTFILPIYNVETYLPQCIDSILCQITEDCEIILVDDGATDNSGMICDRYVQSDSRIKVIHKPNGGLSSARNAGFALADGRYVCFVDSDDYIEPGSVEKLLSWIEDTNADVGFLQSQKVYPDGTSEPMGEGLQRSEIYGKEKESVLHFLASRPKFPASAWGKIYRRSFLSDHSLSFPADRRLSEDLQYSLNLFLAAERFDVLEFPYYCYRQSRAGSITSNISPKYYFDTALFVTETAAQFAPNQKPAGYGSECAMSYAAYEYAILIWQAIFLVGEERKKADAFLKDYRWVLKFGQAKKTKLINVMVRLFGLKQTAKLLDIYMKRR